MRQGYRPIQQGVAALEALQSSSKITHKQPKGKNRTDQDRRLFSLLNYDHDHAS